MRSVAGIRRRGGREGEGGRSAGSAGEVEGLPPAPPPPSLLRFPRSSAKPDEATCIDDRNARKRRGSSSCGTYAEGSPDPAGDRFDSAGTDSSSASTDSSFDIIDLDLCRSRGLRWRGGHGGSEVVEERRVREGDVVAGLGSSPRLFCDGVRRVCSASFLRLLYFLFRTTCGLFPAGAPPPPPSARSRPSPARRCLPASGRWPRKSFEERGVLFLHLLPPSKQTASAFCIIYWKRFQ